MLPFCSYSIKFLVRLRFDLFFRPYKKPSSLRTLSLSACEVMGDIKQLSSPGRSRPGPTPFFLTVSAAVAAKANATQRITPGQHSSFQPPFSRHPADGMNLDCKNASGAMHPLPKSLDVDCRESR